MAINRPKHRRHARPVCLALATVGMLVAAQCVAGRPPPAPRHMGRAAAARHAQATQATSPLSSGDLFELRIRPLLAANCWKCHGEAPRMGNLDLRSRETLLKGGFHGPAVVPGKATASHLYRRLAGIEQPQMPPTGPLSSSDLASVRSWIDSGAVWSDGWWAVRKMRRPPLPDRHFPPGDNPIDAFIQARLREAGLRPAPEASRETLIRRATFDLHGLPPTPEEIDGFVKDASPNAYERLIDRLLVSPRYGERWARHWLDLARYAESEGFKSDETRPNAWRYRDYVIRSFNEDKPYDRFLQEQIAGDEMFAGDAAALVATGFCRHWADESNARNLRLRRQEILNDITDTVGGVVMGVTLGCARCHDHKYDPISQKDYYRLQAFFAAAQPRDDLVLASPEEQSRHRQQQEVWEERTKAIRAELERLEKPVRDRMTQEAKAKFPEEVQEAIDTDPRHRTALQSQLALKAAPQLAVTPDAVGKALKGADRQRWEDLNRQLDGLKTLKPPDLPVGIGIMDVGREAPRTFTLAVGVYDAPKEEVQPGFLSAVAAPPPQIVPPASLPSTGRRTALATWLTSPDNPLTARVMVNRIWQHHFGRGLVATESDFGNAGEPPSHPQLLDWLAAYLVDGESERRRDGVSGRAWSLKRVHRLIMTSKAYRQASSSGPEARQAAMKVDPDNRLLWRMPRRRLEGETIRDAILAVSGNLNLKMGGPSIFPELPRGVGTRGGWPVTADPRERDRRSIYIFVRRNLRYPLFQAFDFPDTHEPCARRSVTTTAPQALMLLNDEIVFRQAQSFAGRVLREVGPDRGRAIERAYRLAFGRAPDADERQLAGEFVERQTSVVRDRAHRNEPLALPEPAPPGMEGAEGAALVDFCHALMNANEFVYVD
jgi:hypothetical protein